MKSILISGGARAGKSHFAQELALKSDQPVLFVATAEAGDPDMKDRIEKHRKSRPTSWRTLEVTTGIGNCIAKEIGGVQTVIVDCITLLVNNVFSRHCDETGEPTDTTLLEKDVMAEINELIDCLNRVKANFILVTNEVGLGIVPAYRAGRLYRDLLGKANQVLAQNVDEVYMLISGIPLRIKPHNVH
jgi:adenosylcobinamide kinase/adenosylcobinamide-phosphate guanylyltransferase